MTVLELEKNLKNQKLSSVYLLYGKETYLLENSLKKIKKLFGELKEGLNYIKIDNASIDMIIRELQTPPFGYEKKLIVVKDTELLKKQGKKKNVLLSEQIDKIATYIEENIDDIKNQNILIFVEEEVDKNSLFKQIDKVRNCVQL